MVKMGSKLRCDRRETSWWLVDEELGGGVKGLKVIRQIESSFSRSSGV